MSTYIKKTAGPIQGWMTVLISLLPMMGVVALMPALPTIREHFKDVPNSGLLVPMIITAPSICIALLAPFAGYFTDKWGRKNLLLIFLFAYGIGGMMPIFYQDFNSVIIGRILLGIGEGFIMTIGSTLIGDYFDEKGRAKWLMMQGIVSAVAGFGLLMTSGYLASISWQWPFAVYGFALILTVISYIYLFEPEVKSGFRDIKVKIDDLFPWKKIGIIFIICLLFSILYFVYTIHISLVMDEVGVKDQSKIGLYTAMASISVPIGSYLYKLFSNKNIYLQFALIGLLIGGGLFGIGSTTNITYIILFGWIQQLGCGMTMPALMGWALNILPEKYRGSGMGFWVSAFCLGQFLNPIYVHAMHNVLGSLTSTFHFTGIICLIGTLIMGILYLKSNK